MDQSQQATIDPKSIHKKQIFWQVFLPLAVCVLLLIGIFVLLILQSGNRPQTVEAWSSVSAIFLVMPVCLGSFISFAILVLSILGVSKLLKVTPSYMKVVQTYIATAGIYVKISLDKAADPVMKLRSQNASWKAFWHYLWPGNHKEG